MAAFLNALKEEGTKDDCLAMLARQFDELTRLRSDLEKAKEALKRFADASRSYAGSDFPGDDYCDEMQTIKVGDLRHAWRILSELENSK